MNKETHKRCPKCEKTLLKEGNFYKDKSRKDGYCSYCKTCHNKVSAGDEKRKQRKLEWHKLHYQKTRKPTTYKNKGAELNNDTHKWCPACSNLLEHKEFYKNKSTPSGLAGICKSCHKEKRNKNKDYQRKIDREWRRNARKDPSFRLRGIVGGSVRTALKSKNSVKGGRTFAHLPYTPQQLKEHLESQFEDWMTWENYGNGNGFWNIDHIIPQSKLPYDSFQHPNFLRCWSLDNLRPLCSIANVKKSDKLTD